MDELPRSLKSLGFLADAADLVESQRADHDDQCAASKRAALIDLKFSKSNALLQSHPKGTEFVERFAKTRVGSGKSLSDLADITLGVLFGSVLLAVRQSHSLNPGVSLDHVHPIFIDQEEVFALSQTYPDGSALIRVATSLITGSQLIGQINQGLPSDIKGSGGSRPGLDPSRLKERELWRIREGATALRYYIVHQRVFGLSGKVMLRKKPGLFDAFALLPVHFFMAHELSHHLLSHSAENGHTRQQELDADSLAAEIVESLGGTGPRGEAKTMKACWEALVSLELYGRGVFIREPQSHPSLEDRWEVVRAPFNVSDSYYPAGAGGLLDIVEAAVDTDLPIGERNWVRLQESGRWDTSYHDKPYFEWVRGLDMASGFDYDRACDLVVEMIGPGDSVEGLRCLRDGDLAGALTRWRATGLASELNGSGALTHYRLVESLSDALRPNVTSDALRSSVAAILAAQLAKYLEGNNE